MCSLPTHVLESRNETTACPGHWGIAMLTEKWTIMGAIGSYAIPLSCKKLFSIGNKCSGTVCDLTFHEGMQVSSEL